MHVMATFKITIKKWHAVAAWTWNAGDDVCGICHTAYDGCPPDCKYPGDDSPVVWGACSHAFHIQCIQKWLASSNEQRCPMCRRAWEYKSALDEQQGAANQLQSTPVQQTQQGAAQTMQAYDNNMQSEQEEYIEGDENDGDIENEGVGTQNSEDADEDMEDDVSIAVTEGENDLE